MSEIINLSDGDIEAMLDGETVGPWIFGDTLYFVTIDDGEPSQMELLEAGLEP